MGTRSWIRHRGTDTSTDGSSTVHTKEHPTETLGGRGRDGSSGGVRKQGGLEGVTPEPRPYSCGRGNRGTGKTMCLYSPTCLSHGVGQNPWDPLGPHAPTGQLHATWLSQKQPHQASEALAVCYDSAPSWTLGNGLSGPPAPPSPWKPHSRVKPQTQVLLEC